MTAARTRSSSDDALLTRDAPEPLGWPRSVDSVARELRAMYWAGDLDLPLPAGGATPHRWSQLAAWGRRDLALARLAEGHTDAVAILAEASRCPHSTALYGVWASRSGRGGAVARRSRGRWILDGLVRFCSGARHLDRALVAATPEPEDAPLLMDISLQEPGIRPDAKSWQAFGMDAYDSIDIHIDSVAVTDDAVVGEPGFYTGRAGFAFGGAGVAAVWLGGCAGVLDDLMAAKRSWDDHQLAHLGAIHTAITSADAVLHDAATLIDERPGVPDTVLVDTCRAAAEHAATEVLTRAPTVLGPGPLCWDERLNKRIADLQVYVRQHHGERDLAELGRSVVRLHGAAV